MKLTPLFKIAHTGRTILAAAVAILSVNALHAQDFFNNTIAGINLGDASGSNQTGYRAWAIFAGSGGVGISNTSSVSYDVVGNVGAYDTASSPVSLSGGASVDGTVYLYKSSQTLGLSGGGSVKNGVITPSGTDSYQATAWSQATTASSTAKGLTGGSGYTVITPAGVSGGAFTQINGSGGSSQTWNLSAAVSVVNLTSFTLSGLNLVINGSSTQNLIVNVSGLLQVASVAGTPANITLSGGLQPQNVLWNATSTGTAANVKGGSVLNGIILATNGTVSVTGASTVKGEVIGQTVSLSGSSMVVNPLVSP